MKYVVSIYQVGLTNHKGKPSHKLIESFWAEERPYPEDAYPTNGEEREMRIKVEGLLAAPGTYLVATVEVPRNEDTPFNPDTWTWTVVVAPPTIPPPTWSLGQ